MVHKPGWGRTDSKTSTAGPPVVLAPLDENVPPLFCTLLWWPSEATFQYAWRVCFFIHPSGWLSACGPNLLLFFFPCFFRRCQRVSAPRGRPRPRGGQTWLCRQEALAAGPGIFGCASCRLNHEQGSRCARDDNAACPRQPLCNQLSSQRRALSLGAWGPVSLPAPSLDTWE